MHTTMSTFITTTAAYQSQPTIIISKTNTESKANQLEFLPIITMAYVAIAVEPSDVLPVPGLDINEEIQTEQN